MGASGTTQSVTQQNIDPALRDRHLGLFDDAQNFIQQQPFQPFPGQQVAGLQPLQLAAQSLLSQGLLGQNFGFQSPDQMTFDPRNPIPFTRQGIPGPIGGTGGSGGSQDPGGGDSGNNGDLGNENNDPDVDGPLRMQIANAQAGPNFIPGGGPIRGGDPLTPNSTAGPIIGGGDIITRPANPFDPTIGGTTTPGGDVLGNSTFGSTPGSDQRGLASQIAGQAGMFQPGQVGGFGFSSQDLQRLQNPFTDQVIDQNNQDILRSADILRERTTGSAGASTFGGDRQAIQEAEQDRNTLDTMARQSAQLRSQGFDRAANLVGQEQGFGLSSALANQQAGLQGAGVNLGAANALNNFGQTEFGNLLGGASALNQFGTQNQGTAQDMINAQMNTFNDLRNAPLRDIGLLQSLLTGMPVGMNTTQSTPTNRGAGIGGGALTGAGIGAAFGPLGAGLGGLGGGLLGLL